MNLPSSKSISTTLAVLFTFACSDPPSPPAQGAVVEGIQPTPMSTVGCQASTGEFTAPPNPDSVSGTARSLRCNTTGGSGCKPDSNIVVDGDNGASVQCSVTGAGPFNVSANLSQGDVAISVQGSITGNAGKMFFSSSHAQHNLQDDQCDIAIEANSGQVIPGAIWATFTCSNFHDISVAQAAGCTATGKFIFENCGK